ncbi:MAG: hypothetical protein ACI9V8_000107 [Urechidicola sp.]|jgi:hypothetical protein
MSPPIPDERRRYFRIEDTVSFTVSAIDPIELQARIENFWDDQPVHTVRHLFNQQPEQHLTDFKVIEEKMPELARYLALLQAQIDNLSAKVLPEQTPAHGTQKVNISGQGMVYISDQKLTTDDTVELYLELLSTGQGMTIFARVVSALQVSGQESEQYRTSLDFTHIYESDQALLVKRINAQQLEDIVAARTIVN